jgi:hypothetical protein
MSIKRIQIDPMIHEGLLVYVVPAWDESDHMEWCIWKNKLIYVGTFRGYPVDGYQSIKSGNFA